MDALLGCVGAAAVILNGTLARRRRVELCRSVRQLAADLGVSGAVITAMEAGSNHKDLSVGFVQRLAAALALDPTTLWITDRAGTRPDVDDAAAVGAVLHASEILTPVATIAEILDWPLDRVDSALDTLDAALPAVGLRLHRLHKSAAIQRSAEAADSDVVQRTVRAHLNSEGLNVTEAKVLARVRDGGLGKELGNHDQVALGVLVNAGLVEVEPAAVRGRQGPWVLTDDVRYSLMISSDAAQ